MPLETTIVRGTEPLKLNWGGFHVAAMVYAVTIDSGQGPFKDNQSVAEQAKALMEKDGRIGVTPKDVFDLTDYYVIAATPLNSDAWILTQDLTFIDVMDGEVLELKRGDVLRAYRSYG